MATSGLWRSIFPVGKILSLNLQEATPGSHVMDILCAGPPPTLNGIPISPPSAVFTNLYFEE